MSLDYVLLDVFTDKPLCGNPLAVVLGAEGLSDRRMQAIAKEFNLSETVFLHTPTEGGDAGLRIFTPAVELPFAGHPTVGAAVLLGLRMGQESLRLEEKVGMIHARVEKVDHRVGSALFELPRLSEPFGEAPATGAIAESLGVAPDEIGCGPFHPALYSAGNPFYLVPVRDAGVLRKVRPQAEAWARTFTTARGSAYIFTQTPEEPDNDLAARMFAPGMGLGEDPGTGSAAAALIGLLAEMAEFADGEQSFRLRQGYEMGRPCEIAVHLRKAGGKLTGGAIGGRAVIIAQGRLDLD